MVLCRVINRLLRYCIVRQVRRVKPNRLLCIIIKHLTSSRIIIFLLTSIKASPRIGTHVRFVVSSRIEKVFFSPQGAFIRSLNLNKKGLSRAGGRWRAFSRSLNSFLTKTQIIVRHLPRNSCDIIPFSFMIPFVSVGVEEKLTISSLRPAPTLFSLPMP